MPKTSKSHPLRVDFLPVRGGGRLGMTLCPGKKKEKAVSGVWDRNLLADLEALKEWGAAVLVSLMEDHEFESLSVRDLGERAEALGMEWHHLPIHDVDVPDSRFESRWVYSGSRLRRHLERGGDVVLHCDGGLGRTGTIAARLLVELGAKPEDAIREVRVARAGTIETASQEKYVRECDLPRADRDRELGCLLGGAVGDGLGYPVEFDRLEAIHSRFGPGGICSPVYQEGRLIVSDDTQMTLFTLEGLLRGPAQGDPEALTEELRKAYMDWLSTQQDPAPGWRPAGRLQGELCLQERRAPGNTCLSALASGGWGTPEKRFNNSKGCGGVMRIAPVGLLTHLTPKEALNIGVRAAAITHGHPTGFWSAGAMAALVALLRSGWEPGAAAGEVVRLLEPEAEARETRQAIQQALELARNRSEDRPEDLRRLGEGWVAEEALAIGLFAALCGKSFPDMLVLSVNHNGDSDSTASIAGQIYGAWKGVEELPHAWVRRLDVFDPLVDLVGRLP
jgi:ADP-ribosyl-[dinitrogen reductase] hydrolase